MENRAPWFEVIAAVFLGGGCAPPCRGEVDLEPAPTDLMDWVLRKSIQRLNAAAAPSSVCITEIVFGDEVSNGADLEGKRIVLDAASEEVYWGMRYEFCRSMDREAGFSKDEPDLFPEDAASDAGTLRSRRARREAVFSTLCAEGPSPAALKDAAALACGTSEWMTSAAEDYLLSDVFPREEQRSDVGSVDFVRGSQVERWFSGDPSMVIDHVVSAGSVAGVLERNVSEGVARVHVVGLVDGATFVEWGYDLAREWYSSGDLKRGDSIRIVGGDAVAAVIRGQSSSTVEGFLGEGGEWVSLEIPAISFENAVVSDGHLYLAEVLGDEQGRYLEVSLSTGRMTELNQPESVPEPLTVRAESLLPRDGGFVLLARIESRVKELGVVGVDEYGALTASYDRAAGNWQVLRDDLWLRGVGLTGDGDVISTVDYPVDAVVVYSPVDDRVYVSDGFCPQESATWRLASAGRMLDLHHDGAQIAADLYQITYGAD